MKIIGKIIEIQEPIEGQNERGDWKKQTFAVETFGDRPKKVAMSTYSSKLLEMLDVLRPHTIVEVSCNVESRKLGERWFTDMQAFDMIIMQPSY